MSERELPVVVIPAWVQAEIEAVRRGEDPCQVILPKGWPGEPESSKPDVVEQEMRPSDSPAG